jgi:excisionase family DNA binding protein
MNKEFYSTIEVARILNISRISVFNRIKLGKIKATKIGRNFIISHNSLLEALGKSVGTAKKGEIDRAIDRAMKDYEGTFRRLSKE